MSASLNTLFECITVLRGARNLAVQFRTVLASARRAPSTASQITY